MRAVLPTLLILLATAAPAAAQEPIPTPTPTPTPFVTPAPTPTPTPTPEPTIASGVSAAGTDLSGQTVAQAEATLATTFGQRATKPVIVAVAGKRFTLRTGKLEYLFDANRTARRAFNAGEEAKGKPVDVALAITFIRKPIRLFVAKAAKGVYLAPRNARASITLRHVYRARGHAGRALDQKKVNAAIERVLNDPRKGRLLKPGRVTVRPAIRTADIRRRYATVITVDRAHFRLRLFKNLKFSRSYGVAVGQPAYPTPTGLYAIQNKQVNPTWSVPNSPWAGEMQGQTVSGGDPNNPLKARWMGIVNGVGIHGTGQDYSIGSRASHGCIRMHVSDVIDLYRRVPVGTPVLIR
jgi:lipoprotein-anchoring transpeptidase ErfK/SrfK